MSQEKVIWTGQSGKDYSYSVFDVDTAFNPNQNGNYIFAKKINNVWYAIYVGEGDIQTRTRDKEHRDCAIKKDASHIHCHLNNDATERKKEESDILGFNNEAYAPSGCNKKIGG